ncbi:SAM-dependent methyltransferase [Hoyosella rhizosphaerae]|uniref:SAM-dependent methyltransferase n=1 Tax=Hoyosella rhizosphaerae TaxID=1755582 RepID=A0A916UD87_9ACTN|nr:methyltransferase domain-containing protein [Hoyosella rhizosphaerae]GGC69386.1 SAM-dependent methyltransferase [Hoyosella rhizosphaerae]
MSLIRHSSRKFSGDTAEMIAARGELFASGHYAPIQEAVSNAATHHVSSSVAAPVVADIGAGSGDYLRPILDSLPGATGIGLDVSKPAARRLSRAHPRVGAVVADVWDSLPIRDNTVDIALSVFAPRNVAETARILVPQGKWIIVTPRHDHLRELTMIEGVVTVDGRKQQRLADTLKAQFEQVETTAVEERLTLTLHDAELLLAMGPTAHHLDASERRTAISDAMAAAGSEANLDITLAVDISVFVTAS